MKKKKSKSSKESGYPEFREIILECVRLHDRLFKNGFILTAQKMTKVVQQVGWEAEFKITQKYNITQTRMNRKCQWVTERVKPVLKDHRGRPFARG